MTEASASKVLEECRDLCRQLASGASLRRIPSDSDTVCVGSINSISSFSLTEASESRVVFASRLLPEVIEPTNAALLVTMLRSEWSVFAESVANSLASSVGGSPPQILHRTQLQQLPSSDINMGGLVLASTMLCKGCRVSVVSGLTRISSSISSGTVYIAEAGVLMMPLVHSGHHSPNIAGTAVVPHAFSPVLPPSTPLSVHFALRGSPIGVSGSRAHSPTGPEVCSPQVWLDHCSRLLCILLQSWDKCIGVNVRRMNDAASFAAAFKRMRAVGRQSETGATARDHQEPIYAGSPASLPQVQEYESSASLQMQLQAILARAKADHFDWAAPTSSVSPMAPVVLQPSPVANISAHVASTPASLHHSSFSPAFDLHTPVSPAATLPTAIETVYRPHRVSPYRYVDTPQSSSVNVGRTSIQAAAPSGGVAVEELQLSSTFDDGAASPFELMFMAPLPRETSQECSIVTSGAVEPAVFSFSTGLSHSAAHLSDQSLRHLILKARARRRVQAQLMREKLCLRALHCVMQEWRRVVDATNVADGMNSIQLELLAQSFVCLRRVAWAPQRHQFILAGASDFHVKSVIARWVQETHTSMRRWCFLRLATAVQRSQHRRNVCDILHKQRRRWRTAAVTGAWRTFAQECRLVRAHLRKKLTFDLKQVCAQYILIWVQVIHTARDHRSKAEMKHRFNLIRSHTHRWRIHVAFRASSAAVSTRLTAACRLYRLSCVLREWNTCTKRVLVLRRCSQRLSVFCQKLLLRKTFGYWFLKLKRSSLLRLDQQIVLQDQAATKGAACIARYKMNSQVLQCYKYWAAFSKKHASRNCSMVTLSTGKKLHRLFCTWLNVAEHCRKRRRSCSVLVIRRRHHLQRLVFHAWAVCSKRAAHARMWLEALCVRWRDSFLVRRLYVIFTKWHSHARSCRLSRFKLQRAMIKLHIHSSTLKKRALIFWQCFKCDAVQKQHKSSSSQFMRQRHFHAYVRRLLSMWLQFSKQRRQMRILMHALNRACDRMLQSKNRDSSHSNVNKWRKLTVQRRARRACCVKVELIVQRHMMSRSFRVWNDCVFSSRERNAVWLLEKARKANTRLLAAAVPDTLCNPSYPEAPWSSSGTVAAAEAVHEAWEVAANGRRPSPFRGTSHASNYGIAHGSSVGPQLAAERGFAVHAKGADDARDLGQGMERLRLCVSLLQKQVHMVRSVPVQRVRLPSVRFLMHQA